MKLLIIGLGSMGTRRIRCLKALGVNNIVGYDINLKRATEVSREYSIDVCEDVSSLIENQNINGVIISTSPDQHVKYIQLCIEKRISCFVEASVTDIDGLRRSRQRADESHITICPSCTMKYYNGPKKIKELIINERQKI